ncbi:hypothetical protein BDV32DRAFT_116589 [Aspergillus pseudonomiae]|uniref:Uncharacterized protein n=1 Tax=Aspergillus pseudonomiae TaxID=1506151 RepID=A0A5N6IGX0_9EURO|nr:uncharacterized protein BDV37DRAFT_255816 [Aspergillus pseudonomiae]KAB8265464.1 hypothetical protein BDV32DRAFT_116589 [Aspergillus pseudonomiae]KAE8401095.1 hypothetical protein BDV37DRAFT_255816 [Aspergillus pseudonomiae]
MDTPPVVNNNLSAKLPVETPHSAADHGNSISATQQVEIEIYEKLRSYPFHTDSEFAKGLAIILSHPDIPATETEIGRNDDLVLQAKCFYFSRKEKLAQSVNFAAYKAWLHAENLSGNQNTGATPQQLNAPVADTHISMDHSKQTSIPVQEPTYPSSFAHIVELITTGQPVPGIQQIPDTILTGHDTPSTKPRRRKPWEKDEVGETS